ncbi:hypothetical protein RFI_15368, partial [Reticulomyxa filosa]
MVHDMNIPKLLGNKPTKKRLTLLKYVACFLLLLCNLIVINVPMKEKMLKDIRRFWFMINTAKKKIFLIQPMTNHFLLANLCHLVLFSPFASAFNRYASLSAAEVASELVQEFVYGYSAYQKYAWGHDELLPLTSSYVDYSSGYSTLWTPIDALDTIYIMNLTDLAEQTKNLICNFSFDINADVAEFDMTIRLLGGLLSAYHFSGETERCLLTKQLNW